MDRSMLRPAFKPRRLRRSEGLSFALLGALSLGIWGLFSLLPPLF